MGSFTKGFQPRAHRERSQPANRARLGLLEKKKDYVLRARDFNAKKKQLRALKIKAAYKNPDEFYYGMIKGRLIDGKVREKGEHHSMPTDVVKLLKSQDLGYISSVKRMNEKRLKKLQEEHLITEEDLERGETEGERKNEKKNGHIKFIQDDDELVDLIESALETKEESASMDEGMICNERGKPDTEKKDPTAIAEFEARVKRVEMLKIAEKKLQVQKLSFGKGRKQKIGQDQYGIPIFKWDMERKR